MEAAAPLAEDNKGGSGGKGGRGGDERETCIEVEKYTCTVGEG